MFIISEGRYFPSHVDDKNKKEIERMPPGKYQMITQETMFSSVVYFDPQEFKKGLVELEGHPFTPVKERIKNFFSKATSKLYKDLEINHFIGCMLYGPPGTGKTCFIETLCQYLVKEAGALAFYTKDCSDVNKLKSIINLMRAGDESQLVVVVIEEVDKVIASLNNRTIVENWLINFCDGANTPNNVLLLCTTNHIDQIPDSLKARPSRFAIVEEVDTIPGAIAHQIVCRFVPEQYRKQINIKELSYRVTEDKVSIDQIKYIILNVLSSGITITEAMQHVTKKHGVKALPVIVAQDGKKFDVDDPDTWPEGDEDEDP